ncbi:VCBS repeat-containing protein [Streptomyces sp. NPDC047046]|uniref:FG-GAP repeat domain-containing protein n=1 Tax=Streptomyces sp. NPDC047046 TaxID=3155378 RepID=UPI00340B1792
MQRRCGRSWPAAAVPGRRARRAHGSARDHRHRRPARHLRDPSRGLDRGRTHGPRDGRPDLLARDTRDGTLWLYRGLAGGGVGARTEYGHGWTTAARPLLAGAADADRDGRADLWATTGEGTGTLLFYAGGTSASGDPTDGPRTTVGLRSWNTIRALS